MHIVTGASGTVGREVLAALQARGEPARALLRRPAEQAVLGDLHDPASLLEAFRGAETVFLLPGYPGAASAARDAGVRRIVLLSGGSGGSGDPANAVSRYLAASEAEVRDTGLEWTVLRPVAFASNALRWTPQLEAGDEVAVDFPDVPLASVDPADIGAVAATCLIEDGHLFMVHRPTGPQALLPAEQVQVLGEAIGRPLRARPRTHAETRREMLLTTPPEYVAAFFDFAVNGAVDESTVRPTVEDVTGRPARTFREWTITHRGEFGI